MTKLKKHLKKAKKMLEQDRDLLMQHPELLYRLTAALVKAGREPGEDDEQDESGDLDGLNVVDNPDGDDDDEAAKWLKEHGDKASESATDVDDDEKTEAPQAEKRQSSYADWKAKDSYTPQQRAAIDKLIADGYSAREAEQLSSPIPKDFTAGLKSRVNPSEPSEKRRSALKDIAAEWLHNADRYERVNADPSTNPMKYLSGKLHQSHEARTKNFTDAYDGFLQSDDVKNLKGLARHKAIQAWKNQYHQDHPEYDASVADRETTPAEIASHAHGSRKASLDEALDHIKRGGVSLPSTASYQEAAQALGQEKEGSGFVVDTRQDPAASYANSDTAKRAAVVEGDQAKVNAAKADAVKPPKKPEPMQIITRRLNPEQAERFKRVQSARGAQGIKPPMPPTEEEE